MSTTCVLGCRDPCPGRHQRRHLGAAVPDSTPARALALVLDEHRLVLTDWIIDELHEVVGRKRPDLLAALDTFLAGIDYELASPGDPSVPISDPDDQPILDAALAGAVDVIVTGDKAFLSLLLDRPRILTARDFLDSSPNTAASTTDNLEQPRP